MQHKSCWMVSTSHTTSTWTVVSTFNSRYNPSLPTTVLIGEVEEVSQQADIPRQLRQPPQPTKKEQEEHRFTHMPCRSWCPICVKAKGQPAHHRRGGLKEQS
eukprot:428613-Amphidinium_carterae.1